MKLILLLLVIFVPWALDIFFKKPPYMSEKDYEGESIEERYYRTRNAQNQ